MPTSSRDVGPGADDHDGPGAGGHHLGHRSERRRAQPDEDVGGSRGPGQEQGGVGDERCTDEHAVNLRDADATRASPG